MDQVINTSHSYFPSSKTLKCLLCGEIITGVEPDEIERTCSEHIHSCTSSGSTLDEQS